MAKAKSKAAEVVRINSIDSETDEVFIYGEDPYVNRVERVKAGKYKLGSLVGEDNKKEEG